MICVVKDVLIIYHKIMNELSAFEICERFQLIHVLYRILENWKLIGSGGLSTVDISSNFLRVNMLIQNHLIFKKTATEITSQSSLAVSPVYHNINRL